MEHNGPQLKEVFGGPQSFANGPALIRQKFLLSCCYLLAGLSCRNVHYKHEKNFF